MLERVIGVIESTRIRIRGFLGAFLGIVLIRVALEAFSSPSVNGTLPIDPLTLVHYISYFLAVYLLLTLVIGAHIREYEQAATVTLFGFIAIWIPPLLDLLFTLGKGETMTYFMHSPKELVVEFFSFLTLIGPSTGTLGLRVTALLLLLGIAWYVYYRTKSYARALSAALCAYGAIFFLASLPSLLYALAYIVGATLPYQGVVSFLEAALTQSNTIHNAVVSTVTPSTPLTAFEASFNLLMTGLLALISTGALVWLFSRLKPQVLRAHIQNIRPLRVAHFLILILAGAFLASTTNTHITYAWPDLISFVCLLIAWCAACVYAICINDIEDEAIDRISNQERPLPSGTLTMRDMQQAASFSFLVMVLLGLAAGHYALFFVLLFSASYYVYSASPLRLKRIPVLSSFLIGIAALAAVCAGFFFATPEKAYGAFHLIWALGIVLFYTLFSNIRDLKDIEGDARAGITTLTGAIASRYGNDAAFAVIGACAAFAFFLTPFFFPIPHLSFLAFPGGVLAFSICISKPYRERHLFYVLFVFLIGLGYLTLF